MKRLKLKRKTAVHFKRKKRVPPEHLEELELAVEALRNVRAAKRQARRRKS